MPDVWAYLAVDASGSELLPVAEGTPLLAATVLRLAQLRPAAQRYADRWQRPVRLARFTTRTDLSVLQPRPARRGSR